MNCQTELYEQPVSHRKDFVLKLNDEEVKVSLNVVVLNTVFSPDTHKWIRCGPGEEKKTMTTTTQTFRA